MNTSTDAAADIIKEIRKATDVAFETGKPVNICHAGAFSTGVTIMAIPAMLEGATYKVERGTLVQVT